MSVTAATLAAFRTRYPAMVNATDESTTYWLTEAQLLIADTWPDIARERAQFAYAAHRISSTGALSGQSIGEGVNSFKSGTFALGLSDEAASRTELDSSTYGREYLALLRQSFAGPRVY